MNQTELFGIRMSDVSTTSLLTLYCYALEIVQTCDGPFLFITKGVFMYLHRADVESLVLELHLRFPGSELVCEVFNDLWLKKLPKGLVNFKMRRELASPKMQRIILRSERAGSWSDGVWGLLFLITGLTLILMKRSLDGSVS